MPLSDCVRGGSRSLLGKAPVVLLFVALTAAFAVILWPRDGRSHGPMRRIAVEHPSILTGVAGPASGTHVAVGTGSVTGGRIWIIDVSSGERTGPVTFSTAGISCLDWSSYDGYVAVGRYDGVISVIDVGDGHARDIYDAGEVITAIAISRDVDVVAVGSIAGELILCSMQGEQSPKRHTLPSGPVADVALSNDGLVALSCGRCGVFLCRTDGASPPVRIGRDVGVRRVTFSSDGRSVFYACEAEAIHEWNIAEMKEMRSVTIPVTAIEDFAIAPDAHFVVSCTTDRIVRLWDWRRGDELARLEQAAQGVCVIDSGRLAVIDPGLGDLVVWDLDHARAGQIRKEIRKGDESNIDRSGAGW